MTAFDAAAIHLHLSPRIAIFSAPEVTASCQANGLTGLDELFKPFQDKIERVQVLSSSLTPTIYPSYPLRFTSYEALERSQSGGGGYVPYAAETVVDVISNLVDKLDAADNKQYDVLRDVLLAAGPAAEHETFDHPLCFVLATSIASPDPLGSLQKLANLSSSNLAYSTRPYMDASTVIRFWLVVHDVLRDGPDLLRSQQLLAQVKKTHGPHASMVVINSAPPVSVEGEITEPPFHQTYARALTDIARNDPFKRLTEVLDENIVVEIRDGAICARREPPPLERYARHLREEDILAITMFLRELATQSIIPYMEARVREWSEIWGNSRRGITGRLFGAGKKFFGSSPKPTSGGSGYNTVRGYYPVHSPEAISRRLADFSFMLRDYSYAAKIYDSIRRDYAQDGATKLAASATEMFGVATLAELTMRGRDYGRLLPDIPSWLEQATAGYRSIRAVQLDSLRATLLFLEAWRAWAAVDRSWSWAGVSKALVRCAEDQDEVPSAILLEQAAAADLKAGKVRRHAAHLVMAAGKYERFGQRSLSRRCLESALPHYRNQSPPWIHAQDFIAYGLGRQAYTSGKSADAVEHFARLLQRGEAADDQAGVLDNFVLAYQQLKAKPSNRDLGELALPHPIFDVTGTKIELPEDDDEEMQQVNRMRGRLVAVGQPFAVSALARNPLNTPINLTGITLEATRLDGNSSDAIHFSTLDISLDPLEIRRIDFEAAMEQEDTIRVARIAYTFHDTFTTHQSLKRRGKRRFDTKQARLQPLYDDDTSLDITSKSGLPALHVDTLETIDVMDGEQLDVKITLQNRSDVDIDRIELFVDPPQPTPASTLALPGPIVLPGVAQRQGADTQLQLSGASHVQLECVGYAGDTTTRMRRSIRANVSPGLSLSAGIVQQDLATNIARMEIVNVSDHEIVVDSIEGESPFWAWTTQSGGICSLPPDQSSVAFGRLQPLDATDASSSVIDGLRQTIANQPVGDQQPPEMPASTRSVSRLEALRARYPILTIEQLCRIFPLFGPEREIDLIVHWHLADDEKRRGRTVLHGFVPGPRQSFLDDLTAGPGGRNMFEQTTRQRAALIESILEGPLAREEGPVRLRWTNTEEGRSVEVQNLSFRFPTRYKLELEDDEGIIVLGQQTLTGQLSARSCETVDVPLAAIEPATVQSYTTWILTVTVGTSESDWADRLSFVVDGRDAEQRRAVVLDGEHATRI